MSRLRARCPDCRTLTAVSLGGEYQCHSCGREFGAGLVRVPRAWCADGEPMARAARLALPWPEAEVVEADSPEAQAERLAAELPDRPLVLGGCAWAHVGAVRRLARRRGRLALVWLDRHACLASPPPADRWRGALRELVDEGAVAAADVALVGHGALDPAEEAFVRASGLHAGPGALERALSGPAGVYVALDADAFAPGELPSFLPGTGGLSLAQAEAVFAEIAARAEVLGAGVSGLRPDERAVDPLSRLLHGLGL